MSAPRFSIVTPVFETPPEVLEKALRSVREQTFEDWELCLVDDASAASDVRPTLEQAQRKDPRIRIRFRTSNGGIAAASNDALEMARGEFVALLDHDDELHPLALAEVNAAIRSDPEVDYVYTDEDRIDANGRHLGPFLKPDWSPERMRTQMYTCHLSVLRRSLVEEVGGFDPDFEGSQDWDLVLKVTERARSVAHVPKVLYHWRGIESSTAGAGSEAKPWAFEAGARAVQAHCDRVGLAARVERDEEDAGLHHLIPKLKREPSVSIVIPTRGQHRQVRYQQVALVAHCVRSIVRDSSYGNYEIVVVADTDTPAAVLDDLRRTAGDRLSVVEYDAPFSFSRKINLGAVHSQGDHLLLLNDDIEVATPNWIERMVMYSALAEVGAVGGKLILEDGRIQHAGVRFEGGLPGHPYHGFYNTHRGYANAVRVAQNALAVTGACLMTRRDLFDTVGGLSTEFPVNYNDVDYCLKLVAANKRIVYDPDLVMYHFESSSRSPDVQEWEKEFLLRRWLPLTGRDPYSNPHLRRELPQLRSRFLWAAGRRPRIGRRLGLRA